MPVSPRPYGLLRGGGAGEGRYALAFEREERSMLRVLTHQAEQRGDHTWLRCDDGASLTFDEAWRLVDRVGHAVVRDVGRGAHVALLLRNQIEFFPAFYGAHAAGGVVVPLNAELRGSHLEHALTTSSARVLVVRHDLLDRVEAVEQHGDVEVIVVVGGLPPARRLGSASVVGWDEWLADTADDPPGPLPSWSDTAVIQYTSGTTGKAKGVVFPHHYLYMASTVVAESLERGADDVLYTPMPVFHVGGLHFVPNSALHAGCTAVLSSRFSPSRFWDEVVEADATFAIILAPMLALVNKLTDQVPEHRLRTIFCVPKPPDLESFEARTGVRVLWQGYGMTEVHPLPGRSELLPDRPAGTLGTPVSWIDYGVVDEHDNLLGPGEVGELVFRSNLPHAMFREYYRDPAATTAAFRNFMFHTGDLASYDDGGILQFRGRKQDRIRRRGEMVGAMEVELGVLEHPGVHEAAAYAVPSPLGEDDIKLDVVLADGCTLDELATWCRANLPKYMVPRFYEQRDQLPKTPSERVEKYKLTVQGTDRPEVLDVEAGR